MTDKSSAELLAALVAVLPYAVQQADHLERRAHRFASASALTGRLDDYADADAARERSAIDGRA